jgi:regulator of sirC expression with transglutaminase-like and TPR domain
MDEKNARDRFLLLMQGPEDSIDLADAALLIAAEEQGGLEIDVFRRRIDALADNVRTGVEGAGSPREAAHELTRFLSTEENFHGNAADYYDPRNSYLNEVLDRRVGIPITLSILWIATAERLGMKARGVGFPGHFLVRVEADPAILIDAFNGRLVEEEDCRALLERATGSSDHFSSELLESTPTREILARVLRNLRQIHLRGSKLERALACCDRILAMLPDEPLEWMERGLLYRALECWSAAERDLEQSLALSPPPPVADKVRAALADLRLRAPRLQ